MLPSTSRVNTGDRRMLFAFLIFTRKVAFESIAATTQEPQAMPTAPAAMLAQGGEIGGGNDREIDILGQMIGHAVKPVDPQRAHRTRFPLTFAVHEMVQNEGPFGGGE